MKSSTSIKESEIIIFILCIFSIIYFSIGIFFPESYFEEIIKSVTVLLNTTEIK